MTIVSLLQGTIAGQSNVAGALGRFRPIEGEIAGQSTVAGDLMAVAPLAGVIAGQSSVAGQVFLSITFPDSKIDAVSSVAGRLRILGEIVTTSSGGFVVARGVDGKVIPKVTVGGALLSQRQSNG